MASGSSSQQVPLGPGTHQISVSVRETLLDMFSASASATVIVRMETCDDPDSPSYGNEGECTYPEDYCWDWDATNYGSFGDCVYPDEYYCWDWDALNYGELGECEYPDYGYCWDWDALNYGQYGECEYDDYPPDPCSEWDEYCNDPCSDWYMGDQACEDPCSDWYDGLEPCDDPCSDWYYGEEPCEDPCSDWYYGEEECDGGPVNSLSPTNSPRFTISGDQSPAAQAAIHRLKLAARKANASTARAQRTNLVQSRRTPDSYTVMLLDKWSDRTVLSMVGRFKRGGETIDVIYLPSRNPSTAGWAQAVRALMRDRELHATFQGERRVLRVVNAETAKATTSKRRVTRQASANAGKQLSPAMSRMVEDAFTSRILAGAAGSKSAVTTRGDQVRIFRAIQK